MSDPAPWAAEYDAAVAFMLDQPGLLDLVLAEHVDDCTGNCAACPGPQSGGAGSRATCGCSRPARSGAVLVSEPSPLAADDLAITFLLGHPELLDAVRAEHVDDGAGRCAACSDPEFGPRRWPCAVRLVAARVLRIRARDVPRGP